MKSSILMLALAVSAAASSRLLSFPWYVLVAALAVGVGGWLMARKGRAPLKAIVRLGGLVWTRRSFCCGWLISGVVGSGKTKSAMNQLLFQVFSNEPTWGGLVVDQKGVLWETVVRMAKHFGREDDVVLLRVSDGDGTLLPQHRYNLTSDRSIPFQSLARMVVDTGVALGQNKGHSFFRFQVLAHVGKALAVLAELKSFEVSLDNALNLLLDSEQLHAALRELRSRPSSVADELVNHFSEHYLNQPPEQLGGVRSSIFNFLSPYTVPAMARVFCRDNTFEMADIDRGKIICLAIPHHYDGRYVGNMMKHLFYTHALRRFDKEEAERRKDNLLVLWADEAQHFVSASDDGMSDFNVLDRLREAGVTAVFAVQSCTSFLPLLGKERADVLTLNLRNQVIFRAADEAMAVACADFLGKRKKQKVSTNEGKNGRSRSYTEGEEYYVKPHEFRQLRNHRCVLVHAEKGFRRAVLPPIEPDGRISPWYRRWRFF